MFEWPFVTKYIKVTTDELNSPEALEFCKMLEELINKAFDVLIREKLGNSPNEEKDTA